MSSRNRTARRNRRGSALAAALFASMIAACTVLLMVRLALATNTHAEVDRRLAENRFRALGALEIVQRSIGDALANYGAPPVAGELALDDHVVSFAAAPNATILVREDEVGTRTMVRGYDLRASSSSDGASTFLRRTVHAEATPIFQWAVFYDGDLEFFPGPSATLTGRVHANGDTYLGCGATLTLDSNSVRSTGGIYRRRKDDPSAATGEVLVRRWVANPFDASEPFELVPMHDRSAMDALGIASSSGFDSDFIDGHDENGDGDLEDELDWRPWGPQALEFWCQDEDYWEGTGHTVMSGDHGVVEATTPGLGAIEMFRANEHGDHVWDGATQTYVATTPGEGTHSMGHFRATADLSLVTFADGSWAAYDRDGVAVDFLLGDAVRSARFFDARQANGSGEETSVLELDLARLAELEMWPRNGLIYVGHYGLGEGAAAKGVVLKHGSELEAPLTVVTESSLYVQGDFNVIDKQPAAVIADAVNLLSNAWDGSKEPGELPRAADTAYNVALITGNHATHVGAYNGGLENLPRFHENWSNVPCRLTGSLVNLWESRWATGMWRYGGDRYEAPLRLWSFDPDFNDFDKLPPHTPMVVEVYEVVTF